MMCVQVSNQKRKASQLGATLSEYSVMLLAICVISTVSIRTVGVNTESAFEQTANLINDNNDIAPLYSQSYTNNTSIQGAAQFGGNYLHSEGGGTDTFGAGSQCSDIDCSHENPESPNGSDSEDNSNNDGDGTLTLSE